MAKDIKDGDIFIFNDKEQVAIEDYSNGCNCIAVTNRRYYLTDELLNKGVCYGYTNSTMINIHRNDNVEIIGTMK